jgi:putative SOS response-associated peptidase YedK
MCGRFTLSADPRDLQTRVEIVDTSKVVLEPHYNVAPSQLVPVVLERDGARVLELMRWGFRPAWMKEGRRQPPINARAETLLARPMFRGAIAKRRCLMRPMGSTSGKPCWAAMTSSPGASA